MKKLLILVLLFTMSSPVWSISDNEDESFLKTYVTPFFTDNNVFLALTASFIPTALIAYSHSGYREYLYIPTFLMSLLIANKRVQKYFKEREKQNFGHDFKYSVVSTSIFCGFIAGTGYIAGKTARTGEIPGLSKLWYALRRKTN